MNHSLLSWIRRSLMAVAAASIGIPMALSQYTDPNRPYGQPDRYDSNSYDQNRYNGDDDRYGSDYDNDQVQQTVARVAYISGRTYLSRSDDPDDWQPLDLNVPVTLGDRIYTDSGQSELEIHGGDTVFLGAHTDLSALNMTEDMKQFSLTQGRAWFDVRRLDSDEVFEVDTPNAAVTLEARGQYRLDVDDSGNTRVAIRGGRATVAAGGGTIMVRAGETMMIDGDPDSPSYEMGPILGRDHFDAFVDSRQMRRYRSPSYQYVSSDIVGAEDLDQYGQWISVPAYGRVWTPNVPYAGWAPYTQGHWCWQDPWGWTWVSYEPWGWAPYHYGRWVNYQTRWCWVPVPRTTPRVAYSPALVAFVGGGPSWSVSFSAGGGSGMVGWFPLGPSEPAVPWWRTRQAAPVTNVTNVRFVNRNYTTVVNQTTFLNSRPVRENIVRDRTVVQRVIESGPVAKGPIPLTPTRQSLRISAKAEPSPAAVPAPVAAAKPVVTLVAPPPTPPTFDQKVNVIQANQGAPMTQIAAARLAVEKQGAPRTRVAVKPVAREDGAVRLRARGAKAQEQQPQAVQAGKDKQLATAQEPVQIPGAQAEQGKGKGKGKGQNKKNPNAQDKNP